MFLIWDKYTSLQPPLLYYYINNKFTTLFSLKLRVFFFFFPCKLIVSLHNINILEFVTFSLGPRKDTFVTFYIFI